MCAVVFVVNPSSSLMVHHPTHMHMSSIVCSSFVAILRMSTEANVADINMLVYGSQVPVRRGCDNRMISM